MKQTPISDILWLFTGTRLLLIAGTYMGFILFPVPPHIYPSTAVDLTGLLTSWDRWDAIHYTQVAQYGYSNIHDTAFFPLFPLLIKGTAFLFGNQGYVALAMIISNGALLGALFVLYQIAADALGDQVGRRTLLYFCLFPTAFFFFSAYNESLFVFLTCASFLAMRRQHWWLASLLGLLAALTRAVGLLLIVPYLYEVWSTRSRLVEPEARESVDHPLLRLLPRALPAALIPLGTLLYCAYCWWLFHNPLAFATVQVYWGRQTTTPWRAIFDALYEIFWFQPFGSFLEAHILLDLIATVSFILLAILGWRQLRTSYTIWIGLLILSMLSSSAIGQQDALVSNQRFVLEMFPGFITLAALGIKYRRLHYALLLAFPFLQAIMSVLFILNRWMV